MAETKERRLEDKERKEERTENGCSSSSSSTGRKEGRRASTAEAGEVRDRVNGRGPEGRDRMEDGCHSSSPKEQGGRSKVTMWLL